MGQKVHPFGIRLGYNKNWLSRWFSAKEYPAFVLEDSKIRKFVKNRNAAAGLAKIEIERAGGKVRLILSTARPGIVIESTSRLSNIAQRYEAGKQYAELLISNYDTTEWLESCRQMSLFDLFEESKELLKERKILWKSTETTESQLSAN